MRTIKNVYALYKGDTFLEIGTAKEIAVEMKKRGDIPTDERNFTAPRLTELSIKGIVEPIGKKKCSYTGKTVSVYKIR